ncbi:hypothetical protein GCM10028777_09780 [Angustibacter speluncae]
MISPSFVEELEHQRGRARADLTTALQLGDDSAAAAARGRLADLDELGARAAEPLLVA